MSHIAYVNGQYLPHSEARVHIEDRGYQFADGIYEYMVFFNRKLVDEELHLDRLERSLRELAIAMPMPRAALSIVIHELMARNAREDGGLYLQVTRGAVKRDHPFPANIKPALTMTIWGSKAPKQKEIEEGAKAITAPDERWARCDIKSIALLPNVLAKQKASAAGVREAFLFEGEMMTEGSVSNTFIVKNGVIITHPADHAVLPGVTRNVALRLARECQIKVEERPFSVAETFAADEVFLTSTSANVMPVTELDGKKIGNGKTGEITKKLLALYHDHIFAQTGKQLA
jgi:D-alanine transaminase